MSDKPTPSEPDGIGILVMFVMSVLFFSLGVQEITTQEADIVRKHRPTEHVTGDPAVRAGIWKVVVGVMMFGYGSYSFIRQLSDSPSEKSPPSSANNDDPKDSLDDEWDMSDYIDTKLPDMSPPSPATSQDDRRDDDWKPSRQT